jgi:hypothetical protein
MIFKSVEIGLFKLPGLVIQPELEEKISEEFKEQLREWSKEHNIGKEINSTKNWWQFKSESERNFFIIRWA